jgi:hypothetical protein
MFSDSKDILNFTIAACILAFTVFSCWGLFYIVGGLRNFFKIAQDIRDIFKKIEGTIEDVRGKIRQSASYAFLFGEALKKIMEAAKAYSERRAKKKEDEEDDCEDEREDRKEKVSDIKKGRKVKVK